MAFSRELALCILHANPGFCIRVVDVNTTCSHHHLAAAPWSPCGWVVTWTPPPASPRLGYQAHLATLALPGVRKARQQQRSMSAYMYMAVAGSVQTLGPRETVSVLGREEGWRVGCRGFVGKGSCGLRRARSTEDRTNCAAERENCAVCSGGCYMYMIVMKMHFDAESIYRLVGNCRRLGRAQRRARPPAQHRPYGAALVIPCTSVQHVQTLDLSISLKKHEATQQNVRPSGLHPPAGRYGLLHGLMQPASAASALLTQCGQPAHQRIGRMRAREFSQRRDRFQPMLSWRLGHQAKLGY